MLVLSGALLLGARPRLARDTRVLDLALVAALVGCAIQLLPVPPSFAAAVSPSRDAVIQSLQLAARRAGWAPLSVDPSSSLHAFVIFICSVTAFVAARELFGRHGVRTVCRGLAWTGLALACTAMVQRALSPVRIYGFWMPLEAGALPYGPFVNRNHCATWLVLATPLCFGYLMARLESSRTAAVRGSHALLRSTDGRTAWLALAGTTMMLALAVSLSRSGVAAFTLAAMVLITAGRSRLHGAGVFWIAALAAGGVAAILAFADLPAIISRFGEGIGSGIGRARIWRDTLPIIRDFWPAGTGSGAYQTAMLLYQTGDRTYSFNQAHNHYLQVAAEGGLLIALPLVIAAWSFVRLASRRLGEDVSGMFWIRAGAAAGLVGGAAQSVWETGLTAPANGLLAAVLAALLVHRSDASSVPKEAAGAKR